MIGTVETNARNVVILPICDEINKAIPYGGVTIPNAKDKQTITPSWTS